MLLRSPLFSSSRGGQFPGCS